jgi:nicotinamidase/pyrazinamidase
MPLLFELDEMEWNVAHRAARLYRCDERKYQQLKRKYSTSSYEPNALILVDIWNDFVPGGALAVPQGDEIVPLANRLQRCFELIVATQDWHPATHGSFATNHAGQEPGDVINLNGLTQILWPDRCVENTKGADFVPALDRVRWSKVFQKGTRPDVDSYSGFFANGRHNAIGLGDYLWERGVTNLYRLGLATDYCVKFTALDARHLGLQNFSH